MARMFREILAVSLLSALSAGAAAQVLILTGKNERFTVFVDPPSLRKKGDFVTMTSVFDYADPQPASDGKKYLSIRRQFEYDCKQTRMRAVSVSSYVDHLGKGTPLATANVNADWSAVVTDSADETLWNYACDKKKARPGALPPQR